MARQVTISADQYSNNWSGGMAGSISKIQDGISRVTESPMEKAAQNKDRYVAGVMAAANSGKWEAGLRNVDLNTWKTNTRNKVGERLQGGVTAAKGKMAKFGAYLIQTINAGLPAIDAMPKLTIQDSINRSSAWIKYMNEHPYKGA